jgi:hypothetical protein
VHKLNLAESHRTMLKKISRRKTPSKPSNKHHDDDSGVIVQKDKTSPAREVHLWTAAPVPTQVDGTEHSTNLDRGWNTTGVCCT